MSLSRAKTNGCQKRTRAPVMAAHNGINGPCETLTAMFACRPFILAYFTYTLESVQDTDSNKLTAIRARPNLRVVGSVLEEELSRRIFCCLSSNFMFFFDVSCALSKSRLFSRRQCAEFCARVVHFFDAHSFIHRSKINKRRFSELNYFRCIDTSFYFRLFQNSL